MANKEDFFYNYGGYGYNGDISVVVDPKVEGIEPKTVPGFYSLLDETRDWRTAIKQHITNEHNKTRKFVEDDNDVTRDELEAWAENDHDVTRNEINAHSTAEHNSTRARVATAENNIKDKVTTAETNIKDKVNASETEVKSAITSAKNSVNSNIATVQSTVNSIKTTVEGNTSTLNAIWNKIKNWSLEA